MMLRAELPVQRIRTLRGGGDSWHREWRGAFDSGSLRGRQQSGPRYSPEAALEA